MKRCGCYKFIVCIAVFVIVLIIHNQVAYAGGINGSEARVISAASGTFEYEGKTYRAGTSYINALSSYLSDDDVDLTDSQASEAISTMYGSVAEGVANGYLYEVGSENDSTQEDIEDSPKAEEDEKKEKDKKDRKDKTTEATTQSVQEQAKDVSDQFDMWNAVEIKTSTKETLDQRPEEEKADVSISMQEDEITIVSKDDEPITVKKEEPIIKDVYVRAMNIFGIMILVITIICVVILFTKGCVSFKKNSSRKTRPGHRKRRMIRHRTRAVLTVTTAIGFIGLFALAGLWLGLFNQDALMRNMDSSGYFRYAYSEYLTNVANDQEDILVDTKQELLTYEQYLFEIKKNTSKLLRGETEIPVPDSNVAPYIMNMHHSCVQIMEILGSCLLASVILGMIFMVFMDQRRERGVKHIAVSLLAASAVVAVAAIAILIINPENIVYITPDYLYLFFVACVNRLITIMLSIMAFGIVLGMSCVGVFYMMKNRQ